MFEMKYFLTCIIIQNFFTLTLCNPEEFEIIRSREIFNNREIVTLERFLEGDDIVLTETWKHPNVMYTSIQCTYADAVVDLLQTFFEIFLYGVNSHEKFNFSHIKMYTKNWLISAINNFNNIQTRIAKMIDKLFFYLDQISVLRTSDQSLLKSLLSINLFLYNSLNNNPIVTNDQNESDYIINDNDFDQIIIYVRSLNKSIIQMIGLVERFRSKRCVVRDPYKYNNIQLDDKIILQDRNIRRLLASKLQRINVLINNESNNYDDFNSNKYDPEYLLFENLISHNNGILGQIQMVLNGNPFDLQTLYFNVKNTFSMEHVLEFQHTFIKVISEVFYTQIYSLSVNTHDRITIRNLMALQAKYKEFVNYMMPGNCSIMVCNKIIKNLAFLDKTLAILNHTKSFNILIKLSEHFEPAMNLELINQDYQPNSFEGSILSSLFKMMWNDPQYETFRRVFRLLSYESYTNSDFNISNVFNYVDLTSSQSYDILFMNTMVELQYALFAFCTLLNTKKKHQTSNIIVQYSTADLSDLYTIGFNTPKNGPGNSKSKNGYRHIVSDMLRVVVKLYTNLEGKPAVKNLLLPLLVHFQHNEKYSSQQSAYDLSITLQMSFLTISLIENFLTRNYSFAFYSIFLYNTFIIDPKIGKPHKNKLRHDLHTYAENSGIDFDETLELLNSLYDVTLYNSFFPEGDRQVEFVWNGTKQSGYDIFQNVLIGVTDFNDLVRLQWFGVKWFVSKIVANMYNTLLLFAYGNRFEGTFELLKSKLNEFLEIEFPRTIKIFLDDVFNSILLTLSIQWTHLNTTTFDSLETIVSYSFGALDAHPFETQSICEESENYIYAMSSKFNKLKTFSSLNFLGTQNILNSTDLSLSPVQNIISDKIYKISFHVT